MCNSVHPLFGIEKRKDTLCLADFCLFWAKTDYSLPLAALYTHFSESKESPARINGAKDFRGSIAAAKAWLYFPHKIVSSVKLSHASEIPYFRSQMLRAARFGVLYKAKLFWGKCYFLYTHAVNRTHFSDQLAVAR